jgi:hypothetical protein
MYITMRSASLMIAAMAVLLHLTSCANVRQAIADKNLGVRATYQANAEQAYRAAKATLRAMSNLGIIEDHKEEGYMVMWDMFNRDYQAVAWIEPTSTSETSVRFYWRGMDDGLSRPNSNANLLRNRLHERFEEMLKLVQEGKPLPTL